MEIKKEMVVVEIESSKDSDSVNIWIWEVNKTKILKSLTVMQDKDRKRAWLANNDVLIGN